MNLYCVKPYLMPGGLVVVADSEDAAVRLLKFHSLAFRNECYVDDVEPYIEAHWMGLSGLEGPERIVCGLKGLVTTVTVKDTLRRYGSATNSTSPIEPQVVIPTMTVPQLGPPMSTAPVNHPRSLRQTNLKPLATAFAAKMRERNGS